MDFDSDEDETSDYDSEAEDAPPPEEERAVAIPKAAETKIDANEMEDEPSESDSVNFENVSNGSNDGAADRSTARAKAPCHSKEGVEEHSNSSVKSPTKLSVRSSAHNGRKRSRSPAKSV